jgi:hypothetical protein
VPPTPEEVKQQRLRLIDHFKRAYQIIVGLAITNACGKVFAHGTFDLGDPALVQFCTFFITVVPIFHGGDRSLDIKYLAAKPAGLSQAAYVWDVYILLATAILFVKIAQAIPGPGLGFIDNSNIAAPGHFYDWMAAMFFFDAVILGIDWFKSGRWGIPEWTENRVYRDWILLNAAMGAACLIVPQAWPASAGIVLLVLAGLRTVADYSFGRQFMFP